MIESALELFRGAEELIVETTSSPWFLILLFSVALLDSVVPVVPSEFSVIAGAVAAGAGRLLDGQPVVSLALVIVFAAVGAFLGDSLAYLIGSRFQLLRRVLFRGSKGVRRLEATSRQIQKRGGLLLITARFIPGGRTALTVSCGLTNQPYRDWFVRWDFLATSIWASYASLLGYFVADAVENQATALWLAFGFALGVTALIEVGRWLLQRLRA